MNDITALMATMKAAAEKASDRGELIVQVNTGNVLALVEALEAKDKEISKLRSVIQASRKYVVVLESQLNGGGVNG